MACLRTLRGIVGFLQRQHDPLVFCLKHPGTGKLYFKTDTEEQRDRYIHVCNIYIHVDAVLRNPFRMYA